MALDTALWSMYCVRSIPTQKAHGDMQGSDGNDVWDGRTIRTEMEYKLALTCLIFVSFRDYVRSELDSGYEGPLYLEPLSMNRFTTALIGTHLSNLHLSLTCTCLTYTFITCTCLAYTCLSPTPVSPPYLCWSCPGLNLNMSHFAPESFLSYTQSSPLPCVYPASGQKFVALALSQQSGSSPLVAGI